MEPIKDIYPGASTAYQCPNCHIPGITTDMPQCPNCHVLFKAAKDIPFDPRTEVSADARHIASRIVTHMWIVAVVLPFIIGLLWGLLSLVRS